MKTVGQQILSYVSGTIVEKRSSAVSGELEVWYQNGKYVLHSPDANYSFDTLHRVFQKAFKKLQVKKRNPKTVLILGFGAGSVATILCDELGLTPNITGIELDPEVIALARKYFNIDRFEKLTIHVADAVAFTAACNSKFDFVVSDLFIDKQVPGIAVQQSYAEDLVKCTNQGGVGMVNWICETRAQYKAMAAMETWIKGLAGRTETLRVSSINYMLIWYR